MRAFACDVCSQLVFFENSVCVSCRSPLGYSRQQHRIVSLQPADTSRAASWKGPDGTTYVVCRNLGLAGCQWLVPESEPSRLCDCCRLTRTRPADGDPVGLAAFARVESAKRRLMFQLDALGLPVVSRTDDPQRGLAFDLLSSAQQGVTTGHAHGVVTLDVAEGDDAYREAQRVRLAEQYRTLLGHLRHEVGHWYWMRLVDGGPRIEEFRSLFGDERNDYRGALSAHYGSPLPVGWESRYVSGYASAHPWEDWAETFAHYLHMTDTLETASAYGLWVGGPDAPVRANPGSPLSALPTTQWSGIDEILEQWLPLTYALNQVERSMGKQDLYPFVLADPVVAKLRFVDDVVRATAGRS